MYNSRVFFSIINIRFSKSNVEEFSELIRSNIEQYILDMTGNLFEDVDLEVMMLSEIDLFGGYSTLSKEEKNFYMKMFKIHSHMDIKKIVIPNLREGKASDKYPFMILNLKHSTEINPIDLFNHIDRCLMLIRLCTNSNVKINNITSEYNCLYNDEGKFKRTLTTFSISDDSMLFGTESNLRKENYDISQFRNFERLIEYIIENRGDNIIDIRTFYQVFYNFGENLMELNITLLVVFFESLISLLLTKEIEQLIKTKENKGRGNNQNSLNSRSVYKEILVYFDLKEDLFDLDFAFNIRNYFSHGRTFKSKYLISQTDKFREINKLSSSNEMELYIFLRGKLLKLCLKLIVVRSDYGFGFNN